MPVKKTAKKAIKSCKPAIKAKATAKGGKKPVKKGR
jgi:hypothetical protein